MITFHKLHLFVVVYERGSFNQAANDLYLAQSAVSQHIQSLEAAFGAKLFTRTAQGVKPTPAGELLYDYAIKMLAMLAEAERAIMQVSPTESRQLSVVGTPGVSTYLLTSWLKEFQSQPLSVTLSSNTALTVEIVQDVLKGKYDLGFLEGDLAELDQPSLGRMKLRDTAYYVAVGGSRWEGRESVSLSELAGEPFINRQPTSRTRRWLESLLEARGIRLRTTAELDSPGAIKYALLNDMGVGILPEYAVEREAERGEIRLLRIDELDLTRPLMLVWDKRQPLTAIQRAFVRTAMGDEGGEVML